MRLQEIFKQLTSESRYVKPDGSEVFNHPAINFIKRPSTMGALVAVFAQVVLGTDGDMARQVADNTFDIGFLLLIDHGQRFYAKNAYSGSATIDRDPQTRHVKTSPKNYMAAKKEMEGNKNWLLFISIVTIPSFITGNFIDDIYCLGMTSMYLANWYRHKQVVDGKYEVLDTPPKQDEKLGEKKESKFGQALPEPSAV